jgi:hypothetical protein
MTDSEHAYRIRHLMTELMWAMNTAGAEGVLSRIIFVSAAVDGDQTIKWHASAEIYRVTKL